MQLQRQQQLAKVSIAILVMSLPVLYVSYLHASPSALLLDTSFWFLISNSIIVVIAADSGMFFFGPAPASDDASYVSAEPVVIDNDHASVEQGGEVGSDEPTVPKNQALVVKDEEDEEVVRKGLPEEETLSVVPASASEDEAADEPMVIKNHALAEPTARLVASKSLGKEEAVGVQDKSDVDAREGKLRRSATEGRRAEDGGEYWSLSDEELNRRVEEFIARFNREIRLQV